MYMDREELYTALWAWFVAAVIKMGSNWFSINFRSQRDASADANLYVYCALQVDWQLRE